MSSSGLSADVVNRIIDTRDPRYITHDLDALVRQRLYQIAAGYEDVNDADRLRHDPTFQLVAGDGRTTLGSQPTLSRLENAIDWSAIQRLARTGVDWFCAYAYGPDEHPADLILDLDSTDDPTHGTQQLALFHGWYDQHMYHPLVWFEGRTGLLLRTRLRPGRDRECDVRSSTSCGTSCRRCADGFRTRPFSCAGTRGWRPRRSKPSSKPKASITCWESARIASSRHAWPHVVAQAQARYDATRTARPPPHQLSASREVVAASSADSGQDRRHGSGPQRALHGHQSPRPCRPISWRGTTTAARRRIGSRSSSSTSTPIASAVIASAPTPSGCSCTASRCCCSRTFDARSSRGRHWRRRPSARSVSTCSKSRGVSVRSVRRLWFHLASHWPGQSLFTRVSSRAGPRARVATSDT